VKNLLQKFVCFLIILSAQICATGSDFSYVIVDGHSGQIVKACGDYSQRVSPCSTFKIVLSLIGFDTGFLKNEQEPLLAYKQEYNAPLVQWQQDQNPTTWIKYSCVWYSQQLTAQLGMERLLGYLRMFEYGNQDLSGNPEQHDGLAKAWLCSSLTISPAEQVGLLMKLKRKSLPISQYAQEVTERLLYQQELAEGWQLYGKGGGGIMQNTSLGWFVGWVVQSHHNSSLIFAGLMKSADENIRVGSAQAKEKMLEMLKQVM
jgi:beta-lactamase class D OXA-29